MRQIFKILVAASTVLRVGYTLGEARERRGGGLLGKMGGMVNYMIGNPESNQKRFEALFENLGSYYKGGVVQTENDGVIEHKLLLHKSKVFGSPGFEISFETGLYDQIDPENLPMNIICTFSEYSHEAFKIPKIVEGSVGFKNGVVGLETIEVKSSSVLYNFDMRIKELQEEGQTEKYLRVVIAVFSLVSFAVVLVSSCKASNEKCIKHVGFTSAITNGVVSLVTCKLFLFHSYSRIVLFWAIFISLPVGFLGLQMLCINHKGKRPCSTRVVIIVACLLGISSCISNSLFPFLVIFSTVALLFDILNKETEVIQSHISQFFIGATQQILLFLLYFCRFNTRFYGFDDIGRNTYVSVCVILNLIVILLMIFLKRTDPEKPRKINSNTRSHEVVSVTRKEKGDDKLDIAAVKLSCSYDDKMGIKCHESVKILLPRQFPALKLKTLLKGRKPGMY